MPNSHIKDLRAKRKVHFTRMEELIKKLDDGTITRAEREEWDSHRRVVDECDAALSRHESAKKVGSLEMPSKTNRSKPWKHDKQVRGEVGEVLDNRTSAVSWVDAAAKNGVQVRSLRSGRAYEMVDSTFDTNAYWAQRMGLSPRGAEYRALGEDTAGSGQAITPQTWTAQFIDYLYPMTLLGNLGASRVMMPTEQVNVPQFTAPVQPQWIAENTATTLDANPSFSSLTLLAKGMFYDITLYSMEMAQDAYIQGGLPGMLAQSAARNFAIAIDQAGFYGVAGNLGCPGFSNEVGVQLRKYAGHAGTTGQAPADTQEMSMLIELVRAKNVEPTGFATSPQLVGTINRLNASTYARYWRMPDDAKDLWANHTAVSTQIPVVETDPTTGTVPAQTGGSYTSIYCADWSRVLIGIHLDMQTQILRERYADQLQIGLLTYMRFSVRLSHPEAFVRSYGAIAV